MSEARAAGLGVLVFVLGSVVIACGSGTGAASVAPSEPRTTAAASSGPIVASVPPGTTQAPLVVDPRLLEILPARVAGVAIAAPPEAAAGMIADPSLQSSASAIAVGIAIDPATFDVAVASVIRLRPGVYSDHFFKGWRLAYDTTACEPAGGVSSRVQQVLGTRPVDVAVCAQGAWTYHVHLPGDVLVSITASGHRRFGELVMAGLRE